MIVVFWIIGMILLVSGTIGARRAIAYSKGLAGFAASGVLLLMASGLLLPTSYAYWYSHRVVPDDAQEMIYEGVIYTRDVRSQPRPLVIHVVEVALDAPGIEFLVTPGEPGDGAQLEARKTSQFLEAYDLQIAVNGDFYRLWPPTASDPDNVGVGDPLRVEGFASSQGVIYSTGIRRRPTLFISETNQAQFEMPVGDVYNAISGDVLFLRDGGVQPEANNRSYRRALNPRTAIALNEDGSRMLIVVVDGRQPNYSEGVSLAELGAIVMEYGGQDALNLDGGGSVTLVAAADGDGIRSVKLNSPLNSPFPGRERPVANHLGIYASPLMPPVGG